MNDALPAAVAALARANQAAAESLLAMVDRRGGGQPVSATVVAQTRQGPLIEAAGNRWLVSGNPSLAQGARLTLDHLAANAQPQSTRLLAVDGQALARPVPIRLQPAATPPPQVPPAESAPRAGGVQVEARVVGPAGRPLGPVVTVSLSASPPVSPAPPTIANVPTGAGLAPQPATVVPAPPVSSAPPSTASPVPVPANAPTPSSSVPSAATAPAPAPPSSAAPQPVAAQAAPPIVPAGAVLPAAVVEHDAEGRLLLQSGDLKLRLETPLDLPLGARLTLGLPQGLPPLSGRPSAPLTDPVQRLIAALLQQESTGGNAQETGALRLPAADHALGARLLRWVQTLTTGAPVLEESAGADEAKAPGELLRGATLELARQAREPQPGGWRVLIMPFGLEEPQVLKIHLREPAPDPGRDGQPEHEREGAVQRAVFEVELSRLGRCQLDVLCQAERFDLVVRSALPLGAEVEKEIRGLIAATRAAAGLAGRLEFRPAELLTLPDPSLPAGRQLTA